jgi:hypothetical protein
MTLTTSAGNPLFEALVEASGLASLFAPSAIARALSRVGLSVHTLKKQDVARALPAIEQALLVYLPPLEVRVRLSAIERLAGVEAKR